MELVYLPIFFSFRGRKINGWNQNITKGKGKSSSKPPFLGSIFFIFQGVNIPGPLSIGCNTFFGNKKPMIWFHKILPRVSIWGETTHTISYSMGVGSPFTSSPTSPPFPHRRLFLHSKGRSTWDPAPVASPSEKKADPEKNSGSQVPQ